MKIRAAAPGDAAAIAAIYEPYVTASATSFETVAPNQAEMRRRMTEGGDLYPWFVATDGDGTVSGYAYATRFRPRPAYRFAVETTVYLAPRAKGQGVGRMLYAELLDTLERQGFVHAIAAITLPNDPSVRLHERMGFERTGTYRAIGHKNGRWLDVGLWQRPLAPLSEAPVEPTSLSGLQRR